MDSGSITALAARHAAVPEHVHGRLRHDSRVRPRARRRRAREGRGDVVPVPDRALRGGAQGRRHGALPAGARLAPRGPARRPELPELLRRPAGQQVRQGRALRRPAATSCSPATRGATTARSSTTTSTTTSRSTTASGSGWSRTTCCPSSSARRLARGRRTCARSTSSAAASRTAAPRAAAGGVRQPLALPRGEDVPARPVRGRGQAQHGARPRDARAVPRQRPRRLRPARAGAAEAARPRAASCALDENEPGPKTQRYFERPRDGKLLLRQVDGRYVPERVTDQVKQGFSGPDASWFRGDSIDYVRRTLLSTRRRDLRVPRPRRRPAAGRGPPRGPREPPAAALVAAQLRAVVPAPSCAATAPSCLPGPASRSGWRPVAACGTRCKGANNQGAGCYSLRRHAARRP